MQSWTGENCSKIHKS